MDFTTVQLIADIMRNGSVPNNQNLMDDSDFCGFMSDCQKMILVPQIMACREEFFVAEVDYTPASNEKRFLIPTRAIGNRVRQVQILGANDTVTMNLQLIDPKMAIQATQDYFSQVRAGYYFENNTLVLTQDLTSLGMKLRVRYFRRPNQPVAADRWGKVLSILGNTLTLENVPTTWTTGTKVDIIHGDSPFDASMDSEPLTAVSGFDVTIVDASDVSVGDYVCFEGETAIPQLPYETHAILVQYALAKVLRGLGDYSGENAADQERESLQKAVFEMISMRDDASPKKVVSPGDLWNSDFTWRW